MCCIGSRRGCSPVFCSSLFGSIANTSLNSGLLPDGMATCIHYPTRLKPMRHNNDKGLCFAADRRRSISLPDVDGCIATVRTPAAEGLLQRGMGDHGFVFAQSLTQNQIAFRPMVVVSDSGAHQNVAGCPLPYSFQREQTISDINLSKALLAVFCKKNQPTISLSPFGCRELPGRSGSLAQFVPR